MQQVGELKITDGQSDENLSAPATLGPQLAVNGVNGTRQMGIQDFVKFMPETSGFQVSDVTPKDITDEVWIQFILRYTPSTFPEAKSKVVALREYIEMYYGTETSKIPTEWSAPGVPYSWWAKVWKFPNQQIENSKV